MLTRHAKVCEHTMFVYFCCIVIVGCSNGTNAVALAVRTPSALAVRTPSALAVRTPSALAVRTLSALAVLTPSAIAVQTPSALLPLLRLRLLTAKDVSVAV